MEKKKEFIKYLFYGITTTAVNIFSYQVMLFFGMDYHLSNLFAILLGKLYAYITNKLFVFETRNQTIKENILEFCRFIFARSITGVIDYFGLIIAVELMNGDKIVVKYILQFIIIVLNYVFSKLLVFQKK